MVFIYSDLEVYPIWGWRLVGHLGTGMGWQFVMAKFVMMELVMAKLYGHWVVTWQLVMKSPPPFLVIGGGNGDCHVTPPSPCLYQDGRRPVSLMTVQAVKTKRWWHQVVIVWYDLCLIAGSTSLTLIKNAKADSSCYISETPLCCLQEDVIKIESEWRGMSTTRAFTASSATDNILIDISIQMTIQPWHNIEIIT